MVELKTNYELNHVYTQVVPSPELAIGLRTIAETFDVELFEKSLALASDLKRLPILRGISGGWYVSGIAGVNMQASGLQFMSYNIKIYNGEVEADESNMLGSFLCTIAQTLAGITHCDFELLEDNFQGGILLNEKIQIITSLQTDVVGAGAILNSGRIVANLMFEIDWQPISKKQFEDFILESVYAKGT